MIIESIDKSISEISRQFEKNHKEREKMLKESRDVISFSSKAIMNVHISKFSEAESNLRKAKIILKKLKPNAINNDLAKYLIQPEAEFVEASIFYALVKNKPIPSYKDLNVSGGSYTFGLLDLIGEVKRRIYDLVRKSKTKEAVSLFILMEKIYGIISPLVIYDNIMQGVKRKTDVARYLIEDMRAIITEEIKRFELIKAIKDLSEKLPFKSNDVGKNR